MFYKSETKEVLKQLGTDEHSGLTGAEAQKRLTQNGENALKEGKKESIVVKFFKQFADALIIILLIAAVVSLIIDPKEWVDSVVIFVVVMINAILGVVQESKAEKSLDALKKMSAPTAKVIRDGQVIKIPSKDLVIGDIIVVEAGDYVPADARIIEAVNLKADESSLTGESLPVEKNPDKIEKEVPLGDRKNMLFYSSFVTYGRGVAVVTETGMNTEVGKIATILTEAEDTTTPLQHKLNAVGKVIGIMCLVICVVVFFLEWRFGLKGGSDLLESFKSAVALAVAAVPEGLATVVTIVLAIGVQKMAKENAIVKKLPAVETLGSTNVICSDKTGTLTQNKMTVVKYYDGESIKNADEKSETSENLAYLMAICCDAKIEVTDGVEKRIGDPTETALIEFDNKYGKDISGVKRLGELPFDSERKLMTVIFKEGDKYLSVTKGAPDVILSRVTNKEKVDSAVSANKRMGEDALRVLGLAVKTFDEMPTVDENLENDMTFIGLVGMIDPPRPEVVEAVKVAKKAGIRTVMITGDHVVTASAIAKQLGILREGDLAISTEELNKMTDEELLENIEKYSVYARVTPTDKVRIVETWQKKGKICAMTGDGVNDSPALKKSDIGCAMGITGTDVSKEAADMILTDDNFSTIVTAVKEGRGIYANVKKCIKFLLSSNIGEVVTIFVATLLGLIPSITLGVPLLPIHLLWINLITDCLPAVGLGMEKADKNIMDLPARDKNEGFFSDHMIVHIVLEGVIIGLMTLTAFLLGEYVFGGFGKYSSLEVAQTMAFVTLATIELFHAYNNKVDGSVFNRNILDNRMLNLSFVIGAVLSIVILYIPGVNGVLNLVPIRWYELLTCVGLGLSIIAIMEVYKAIHKICLKKQRKCV